MKNAIIIFSFFSILYAQDKIKFDPNKLNDPELNWPSIVNLINSEDRTNNKETNIDSTFIIVEGFRVQLLATRDRFSAEKFQSELEQVYNKNIYIIFEAPNYKVRIGDFIDRERAEEFRKDLSNKGYPSAWIIRTKITPINN